MRHEEFKRKDTKRGASSGKIVLLLLAIFITALAGGALGAWIIGVSNNGFGDSFVSTKEDGNKTVLASEEAIARVAREVSPSVVSITTSTSSDTSMRVGRAAGTGIIVSKDGYIMTNKHVVADASSVTVTTTSGDIYENVKVVAKDPLNDVAFLKVEGVNDLNPAEIGRSDTLQIGQTVVAIGNSLGQYQNTVTSGIVSGLGRPVVAQSGDGGSESLSDLIQTDAAINPGNSGGPLVNLKGQVVGINTAVASEANGIGFAIPINATKGMLKSLLETGEAKRAYIGVRYLEITPALAEMRDLPVKQGALITATQGTNGSAVIKGSPADKAGLKEGDIVTKIDGKIVGEKGSISSLISAYAPGETVEVTYLRDGNEKNTKMTLAAYEPTATAVSSDKEQRKEDRSASPFDIFQFGH